MSREQLSGIVTVVGFLWPIALISWADQRPRPPAAREHGEASREGRA